MQHLSKERKRMYWGKYFIFAVLLQFKICRNLRGKSVFPNIQSLKDQFFFSSLLQSTSLQNCRVHHYTIQYITSLQSTSLHCILHHYTIDYITTLQSTSLHYIVHHFTVEYTTALYITSLHHRVHHCTVEYITALQSTSLHCRVHHCTVEYITALYTRVNIIRFKKQTGSRRNYLTHNAPFTLQPSLSTVDSSLYGSFGLGKTSLFVTGIMASSALVSIHSVKIVESNNKHNNVLPLCICVFVTPVAQSQDSCSQSVRLVHLVMFALNLSELRYT